LLSSVKPRLQAAPYEIPVHGAFNCPAWASAEGNL
jgi:hypothetical protein